jgi:hypothetical protein
MSNEKQDRWRKHMKYGILPYPHSNKRYFESLKSLCMSEFIIVAKKLGTGFSDIGYQIIGGIELLCFTAEPLEARIKKALHNISTNYLMFEVYPNDMLKPAMADREFYFKTDFSGILKYKGKTNEMFTDMLLNLGIFSGDFHDKFDEPLNVLDPLCGKGTTLYSGLIKGYNTAGIELNKKDVQETNTYIKKYLEHHRYKHSSANESITLSGKTIGKKTIYETADTAQNFRNKDYRVIQLINGDTSESAQFFKKDYFHTIIADLPYGVQHASKSQTELVKPEALVKAAISGWKKVLAKGGTIVLSYNTNTLKRTVLDEILKGNSFDVLNEEPYNKLEHWVEQAISRDVIVGRKK